MTACELPKIYTQRLGLAAEASRKCGRVLALHVDGSDDYAFVVYYDPRVRRVIARGSEHGMRELLPALNAEYARQRESLESGATSG
jgi:hypothetical protein